ncbi:hypothetical protein CRE_06761 [Caenorhabditis remanei]|uniref:Integrase catalytic domain-containing protein n=1 Tax=Caenorhabditis remanei TaxID=31234 RepID=E3MNZ9_CAERE|nr:hypothetical protein CRE_06761 [Caenorhabditis remanei]
MFLTYYCQATNSFQKMIRIALRVLKAAKIFSKPLGQERFPSLKDITLNNTAKRVELKTAETLVIKDHQKGISYKTLQQYGNLGIIPNKDNILVAKGRMELAGLEENARNPIFILPNSQLAKQIIADCHGSFHKTMEHTMDSVRRRFWIPKLRQQTKSFIARCIPCQRNSKQPCRYPDMGRIPRDRVNKQRPFGSTGLDNFGPIQYRKDDGTLANAYGTIFTCTTTRLIHVETVKNASALEFIQAFRKFVAIRGRPTKIVSDNGTNFVLGQKIIEEAFERSDCPPDMHKIDWKFITPYAPWKGGVYERMVKSVKEAFYKAVGRSKLTFEELTTVLYEATASINQRPLTKLEDDINAETPIRPCDFINQEMEIRLPLEGALDIKEDFRPATELQSKESMLNTVEALKSSIKASERVWKVWNSKYLAEMREGHKLRMDKKRGSPKPPKVGQLVLMCEELQPRNTWKMAKILRLNESSDGVVRDVDILTPNGRTLNRTINLIVPLELDEEDKEDETEQPPPQMDQPMEVPEKSSDNKKRYNLRSRKVVNYKEEEPTNNFVFSSGTKWTNMMFICTLLTMFSRATATDNIIHCTPNGIKIEGQFESFESCVENYCTTKNRWEWSRGQGVNVWFPPAIKIYPHHVTTKIKEGDLLQINEMDCEAVPFCQTIDCTICWTNIINPECHISWAILGVGALIFLLLFVIHATCKAPVKCKDVLGTGWTIILVLWWILSTPIRKAWKWFRKETPVRRSTWKRLFTIIVFLSLTRTIHTCQEVDLITQFETVCDTDGKCETITEEIMHLNNAHKEGCLRIERNRTILRDIRVQMMEIELHCVKRTITHTQDIETKVWSTKRCPHMGSCGDDKCTHVKRNTKIQELDNVNSYVGNTVTTLNTWKNKVETVNISSPLGRSTWFKDMMFTVVDINTPPSPSLNTWFITNTTSMATWPENLLPHYQCNQKLDKCVLDEECQCSPAEDTMICTCKDTDMRELFRQPDRVLPVQAGHLRLEQDGNNVKGKMKFSTSTTMSIKMTDKWTTSIVRTKESCSVASTTASGCYKCEKGATAEITCKTNEESTTANIECGEEEFAVECSPTGTKTNLKFFGNKASFQRHCTVDCGGKQKGHFEVTGVLKYSGSIWTAMWHLLDGNTTIFNEINLPDMGHIATSYMSFMKTMFAVTATVGIIFLLTYTVITNAGLAIVKTFFKICSWIVWQPIRGIIYLISLITTKCRRRRGHLHILIVIPIITALISPVFGTTPNTENSLHTPLFSGQYSLSQTVFPCSFLSQSVSLLSQSVSLLSQSVTLTQIPFKTLTISIKPDKKRIFTGKTMQRQSKIADQATDKKDKAHMPNVETIKSATKAMEEWKNMKEEEKREKMVDRNFMLNMDQKLDAICQYLGIPLTNSPRASPDGDSEIPEAVRFEEVEAGNGQEEDPVPRDSSPRTSSPQAPSTRASSPLAPATRAPSPQNAQPRLQSKVEVVVDNTAYKMRKLEKNPKKGTTKCLFCKEYHYSDLCPAVPEADERRTIAMDKGRCFQCLLDDQKCKQKCKAKPCHYCNQTGHHSALCLRAITKWVDKGDHRKHRRQEEDKTGDHRKHRRQEEDKAGDRRNHRRH